ncbi:MAG: PTS sugar transporter subunit IIA, partial [Oscillospiraceae bacterium]
MQQLKFLSIFGADAASDSELLSLVADKLYEEGYVKQTYKSALLEREKKYPTGIKAEKLGVSIPHTDCVHVNCNAIVTVTTKNPIRFNEMGGEKTDFVDVECLFFILLCEGGNQIKMLMNFMKIIQNTKDLEAVKASNSDAEVAAILGSYLNG